MVEMADLREAQRSYQANIKAIEASRAMLRQTIDLLR
jgi:flagellar basal-body rod protein FlgC